MKYMSKIGVVLVGLLLATVGAQGQAFIGEYEYSDGAFFETDVTVQKAGSKFGEYFILYENGDLVAYDAKDSLG